MNANERPRRPTLGRGLSALIPLAPTPEGQALVKLAVEEIQRHSSQPRKHFDQARLEELASSIKEHGVLQPILVQRVAGEGYRIIAGERRWRAAQLAGLKEIPAIIKEVSAQQDFELAIIENIQREDLNPIEEAEAYSRLIDEHGLTQEQVAQRVSKDRSTVANALRLLQLPDYIKSSLVEGALNMGHARALLGVSDDQMKDAADEVIRQKLSVRATEGLVRKLKSEGHGKRGPEGAPSPHLRDLQEKLQRALGSRVRLLDQSGKGQLQIDFGSYEELDRLVAHILRERPGR